MTLYILFLQTFIMIAEDIYSLLENEYKYGNMLSITSMIYETDCSYLVIREIAETVPDWSQRRCGFFRYRNSSCKRWGRSWSEKKSWHKNLQRKRPAPLWHALQKITLNQVGEKLHWSIFLLIHLLYFYVVWNSHSDSPKKFSPACSPKLNVKAIKTEPMISQHHPKRHAAEKAAVAIIASSSASNGESEMEARTGKHSVSLPRSNSSSSSDESSDSDSSADDDQWKQRSLTFFLLVTVCILISDMLVLSGTLTKVLIYKDNCNTSFFVSVDS